MPAVVASGLLDRYLLLLPTVSLLIDFFKTMFNLYDCRTLRYGLLVDDFKEVVCFECGYGWRQRQ
jgi:hypothetical protein